MKKDPLEEAAKEYSERHLDVSGNLGKYLVKAVFQDGGKWEQEQDKNKYSEEDMKQFAFECVANFLSNDDNKVEIKLVDVVIDRVNVKFEKFKKK